MIRVAIKKTKKTSGKSVALFRRARINLLYHALPHVPNA